MVGKLSVDQTQDTNTSIRYIRETDYPDILRLSQTPILSATGQQTVEEDRVQALFLAALENRNSTGIILVIDGVGRGYVFGHLTPHYYHSELMAYCMSVYVEPEYRRYGLDMIKAFEAWGKYKGAKILSLSTFKGLSPKGLDRLYQKLGYQEKEVIYWKEV